MTRVKICGITRRDDALLAVSLGATAVGFVLWPESPRGVDLDSARAIARGLPALVARVGVFVNPSPVEVAHAVRRIGLTVVQLHGDEDVELFASVGAPVMKAVSLTAEADVAHAIALPDWVTPLVDAIDPAKRGGTGHTASWELASALARARPTILAGGLRPENVADAIRRVQPWAVDVSSGVESTPGVKSAARLAAFMAAVAEAEKVA